VRRRHGTGSLTVRVRSTTWQILDGSGEYADLRGRGWVRAEPLEIRDSVVTFRSTLGGVADLDVVAPTIAIASARAAKLRRPAGAYSIKVALALRDDVEGNSVSYTLRVFNARGIELARKSGTAETEAVPLVLRVLPRSAKKKTVRLELTASDPVGNATSLTRVLKLRR
jgi:hypothetical protein